jgi:hypothetical protein
LCISPFIISYFLSLFMTFNIERCNFLSTPSFRSTLLRSIETLLLIIPSLRNRNNSVGLKTRLRAKWSRNRVQFLARVRNFLSPQPEPHPPSYSCIQCVISAGKTWKERNIQLDLVPRSIMCGCIPQFPHTFYSPTFIFPI